MPARRRYWRTERVPPILWRSSSRKMGRQDDLSSDECSSPPRNYCTINQEMVKHGGFSFAPDGSESISVTPDNASTPTTDGTITQYEIMDDDLLSEGIQRKNKAMFHMEHLKHELTRWITTTQKHRKTRKNIYRHRTNQRSSTMRRKSSSPSRTPLRRKRSPQKRTNTCLFDGLWLTNDKEVVEIKNGKCPTFQTFRRDFAAKTCTGTNRGDPGKYQGALKPDHCTIIWDNGEDFIKLDMKRKQHNGATDHKTKYTTRSRSTSHHHTRMQ